jgi:hypothetical protein
VPERHERVGGQVVRRVGLARQQMGEPGEFGVVRLEERTELGGSSIIHDCAHGNLFSAREPCALERVVYVPNSVRGARAYQCAPRKRFDAVRLPVRRNATRT